MKYIFVAVVLALLLNSFCTYANDQDSLINISKKSAIKDTIQFEGEKHFANVCQLTFGGDNAEAYFSF